MYGKEGARIFIGGLSWNTTERQLADVFSRFGKVLDVQIMVERDTGRPRGFGFVTFSDKRAMEAAIDDMHNKEFAGRQISVNKAEPKMASDDTGYGYNGSGGRYRGGADDSPPVGRPECFRCGRLGHWAHDCSSGDGGRFPSRSRNAGGGRRGGDRYVDERFDGEDSRRRSGRDRYPPARERFSGERYDGYRKERSFDGDVGQYRRGGGERYGSGRPARYGGGGGGRERPGPYDRPGKGGRSSSLDDDRY